MKYLKLNIVVFLSVLVCSVQAQSEDNNSDEVHLTAEVSESSVTFGEAFEINYKLYVSHSVGIQNWEDFVLPDFTGFEAEKVENGTMQVLNTKFNGKPYRYVLLSQIRLTPNKKGAFQFDPASITITMDVPSKAVTDSGKRLMESVTKTLNSDQLNITVK